MQAEWALLWLLLPVAAFSGWWVANWNGRRNQGGNRIVLNPKYFEGLNYVLNEQPDKAIEVFVKMVEVDSETVETHLALGNLFRRRGEVDRAIRIHQNLIARPTLSEQHRAQALLELGMDYMRSGLLDRAEGLFNELVDVVAYGELALEQLLDIYQQEKDWKSATDVARRLETVSGQRLHPIVAQFYCELATEQFESGNDKEVADNLKKALNTDPRCVRASLLEGKLLVRSGRIRAAIKAYERVEKQDPDYLPEIVIPLCECHRQLDLLDQFVKYLQRIVAEYGGITPLLFLADLLTEIRGQDEAIGFVADALKNRPTIRGVSRLVQYTLNKADGEVRDNLASIKNLMDALLESRSAYKCILCGFDARHLHWQCPGCKNWNSVKPIHGVEGE